jgi:hypothetical protein
MIHAIVVKELMVSQNLTLLLTLESQEDKRLYLELMEESYAQDVLSKELLELSCFKK